MCLDHPNRFPRLHQEGLVWGQVLEFPDDGIKCLPRPGRLPASAVDHQLFWDFGNLGVKIVHQHP